MKYKALFLSLTGLLLYIPVFNAQAQEPESTSSPKPELVKNTFENGTLINNQTVETPLKNSLDFMIQHRFGVIDTERDLFGLFAPSNIRLGLTYGITKKLSAGIGATKNKMLYDLHGKYAVLNQTKNNKIPVTVVLYGNISRSARDKVNFLNQDAEYKRSNRLSYFSEIMVARKFTSKISLQAGATYSYFNIVENGDEHGYLGLAAAGRFKFSPQSSFIVDYNQTFTYRSVSTSVTSGNTMTETTMYYTRPNLGIGYEVSTGSHQFQLFVCNADAIINQEIMVYNSNRFDKGDILFGFNITRQWGF